MTIAEEIQKAIDDACHDSLSPPKNHSKNYDEDVSVYSFPQEWSDTSLGFGGVGGRAFATAQTTIITSLWTGEAAVYFGSRHAYTIKNPNSKFYEDVRVWNMSGRQGAKRKYERNEPRSI